MTWATGTWLGLRHGRRVGTIDDPSPDAMTEPSRRRIGNAAAERRDNRRVIRTRARLAAAIASLVVLTGCGSVTSVDGPAADPSAVGAPSPANASSSASPSSSPAARPEVVTITSQDVPLPAPAPDAAPTSAPQRIVSLATGVAETVAALGAADRLVGRDETSDVPEIAAAPVVTKAHATSPEMVLALQPDLVLVDAATSPPEAIAQIESAGVRVVSVPEAWTVADIAPRTQAIATAIGAPDSAAAAVIAEATTGSSATPATAPRVAFLYLRGTAAVYLLGGAGSGADALIDAAGGLDAGAEAGYDAFVPLTAEALASLDPDVLLVMTKGLESVGGIEGLVQLPGVAQTTAGRERRVVAVDDTLLLSFGPRTGALIDALSGALATASSP